MHINIYNYWPTRKSGASFGNFLPNCLAGGQGREIKRCSNNSFFHNFSQ